MITLYDALQALTYGEFQHLKVGNFFPDQHDSEPDPRAYAQLCSHVNMGLTAMFSRFPLRFEEIDVQLHEEITDYFLSTEYSSAVGTAPVKYIMDTVSEPFTGNVLKIEEVYEEDGDRVPMNDVDEDLSVFTPRGNLVQVPWPNDWITISVQYRANHPKINWQAGTDPSSIELEIEHQFFEPLLFYVASRMMSSNLTQEGATFWSKYQNRINFINDMGLYPQAELTDDRLQRRGFV
jgi:hypothetical protein